MNSYEVNVVFYSGPEFSMDVEADNEEHAKTVTLDFANAMGFSNNIKDVRALLLKDCDEKI